MYAWRGYSGTHRLDDDPNRITLSASDHGEVVGTVTLGIDSPVGLLADEVFKDEIDRFRARGAKVCEITKLAFDPKVRSKAALASLFHVMFIYGRRLHKCTDVFIEVNPRHRRFYETMLGFKRVGELRINPRVDAPGWLLWNSLDYIEDQIERYGGTSDTVENERSLFPYFFSQKEEEGITRRLTSLGYTRASADTCAALSWRTRIGTISRRMNRPTPPHIVMNHSGTPPGGLPGYAHWPLCTPVYSISAPSSTI
jgi:hypothetical protein